MTGWAVPDKAWTVIPVLSGVGGWAWETGRHTITGVAVSSLTVGLVWLGRRAAGRVRAGLTIIESVATHTAEIPAMQADHEQLRSIVEDQARKLAAATDQITAQGAHLAAATDQIAAQGAQLVALTVTVGRLSVVLDQVADLVRPVVTRPTTSRTRSTDTNPQEQP